MKPTLHIDSEWCGFVDYYPIDYGLDFQIDACWKEITNFDKAISSESQIPAYYRIIIFDKNNNDVRQDIEASFRKGLFTQSEDGETIFSVSDRIV